MTEEVSKERLQEHLSVGEGFHAFKTLSADEVRSVVSELLRLRSPTEARGGPFEEARQDAWSLFEAEYLTDGEGHAPASTYSACREAFNSAWNGGNSMEATRAAIAAFKSAHPPAREAVDDARMRSLVRGAIDANMIGGTDSAPTVNADGLVGDVVAALQVKP
jgi:hypothetical protein